MNQAKVLALYKVNKLEKDCFKKKEYEKNSKKEKLFLLFKIMFVSQNIYFFFLNLKFSSKHYTGFVSFI